MADIEHNHDTALIIYGASAGRALRGSWPLLDIEEPCRRGTQMLLQPHAHKEDLRLMRPTQAMWSKVYCFFNSEDSNSFVNSVKEKGWSVATRLHSKFAIWSISTDPSFAMNASSQKISEQSLERKVSQACITQSIYMPLACFQIPRTKMVLSEAALLGALAIQDSADANDFLRGFGPFASESLYHLGGVFFSEVSVECSKETSLSALMTQAQKELKGSFDGGIDFLLQSVTTVASRDSTLRASSDSSGIKLDKRAEKTIVLGPADAVNAAEFLHKMMENSLCMEIIDKDRDSGDSLVGVWNLLRQYSDKVMDELPCSLSAWGNAEVVAGKLKFAARLLCERWLEEVATVYSRMNTPSGSADGSIKFYSALIDQSRLFVATLASDHTLLQSMRLFQPPHLVPLPESPKDLVQALEQLVVSAEGASHGTVDAVRYNISQDVADVLRSHFSGPSRDNSMHSLSQEGLRVFRNNGFHPQSGEWKSRLSLSQLKAMIQELKDINPNAQAMREHIPTSLWDDDLIVHSNPAGRGLGAAPNSKRSHASLDSQHEFQYFGDMLVDRSLCTEPPASCFQGSMQGVPVDAKQGHVFRHAAACRLIDCLRHRLNPLQHRLQVSNPSTIGDPSVNFPWDSDEDADQQRPHNIDDETEANPHHMGLSPFELLIHLMQGSDFSTQVAICDLLLSQRSAVPLIVSSDHVQQLRAAAAAAAGGAQREVQVCLEHYMQAMSFVKVNLGNERKLRIANDTSLPRVVFISNRSVQDSHAAIVASRVLSCDFLSQYSREEMNQLADERTVMEVGVGFVPASDKSGHMPCVCIQITGHYQGVLGFVGDFADVVVLELEAGDPEGQRLQLPRQSSAQVLRWKETATKPGFDRRSKVLWGQETYLVHTLQLFLHGLMIKVIETQNRAGVLDVCSIHFQPGRNQVQHNLDEEALQLLLGQCDFRDMRKRLSLQRSLLLEADAYFEGLNVLHDPAKKHEKDKTCEQERHRRLKLAKDVLSLPLMRLFYHVLKQSTVAQRRFGIMWLERALSEKMFAILEDASLNVDRLFEAYNRNREDKRATKEYCEAKQDYVDKGVELENLWREMCHIYEADPDNQRHLAKLAARHLLDGFPLEILDGDAGMYCKLWVESVLVELDSMTKVKPSGRSARIFVLSVMGLQSSGKSTMLNLMFGSHLRTSAGRCTRGVYMQLVPSQRQEYDYVLLLDTEGLRSPEFSGLPASLVRDNRLATFGLLPSDASMFMVCNEDDGGLKEVLPMVLLAFKGSAIAEECGQRIKAKVVFVYRGVDISDKKRLKGSTQKLHEHLMVAAEEVLRTGGMLMSSRANHSSAQASGSGASSQNANQKQESEALLSDFRVRNSEEDSDVKFLGNLKRGTKPPTDTPEWEYGESVVALREYLHSRVVNDSGPGVWNASSLTKCAERLQLVWDCICSANFELSFASRMQYAAYLELQERLQLPRTVVCNKYLEAFRALEQRISSEDASSQEDLGSMVLEADVRVVVNNQTKEVEDILDMQASYAQWKLQELGNWQRFCESTEDWYEKRIRDLISGVRGFDNVVADYQQQCKSILVDEIERGQWGASDNDRKKKFETLFKRILDDAEKYHSPIAKHVVQKVQGTYYDTGVAKVFNMHESQDVFNMHESQDVLQSLWQKFRDATNKNVVQPLRQKFMGSDDEQARANEETKKYADLGLMIERQLRDANQYSDVIVVNVINATKEILKGRVPGLSKEEQGKAHVWVRDTLTRRLKDIQSKWDQSHNVKEKLNSKEIRGELENFFADLCMGLEATGLLVNQLQRGLEKEVMDAHSAAVVRYVVDYLGTQSWVRNWRLMRSFLDYHLLTLMETGTTTKLLQYVVHPEWHFQVMVNALAGQAIGRELVEREWGALLRKVQKCLREEGGIENPSVEVFLATLKRRLDAWVGGKLANAVVANIHVNSEGQSRKLDGEFYKKKLPELCESLQRMAMPRFEELLPALTEHVMTELSSVPDENCRPRCGAACPECGSACYQARGHNAARHDTIHQPAGLGGHRWFGTTALMEKSCLQCLDSRALLVLDNGARRVPFLEFETEYPAWAMPTNDDASAIQVRECVFYHYHQELVNYLNTEACGRTEFQPSRKIPRTYNHDRTQLRTQVRNTLRVTFPNDESWAQFTQLLNSL